MADSDATVIAASLDDPRAFVAIFERHFDSINRYLRRRLSRIAADDLAAEVFATAFSRRCHLHGDTETGGSNGREQPSRSASASRARHLPAAEWEVRRLREGRRTRALPHA